MFAQQKSSFLGDSRAIRELRRTAARLADAPFPIVIEGETGTGKFELALLIHERSSRSSDPFLDIHCANLSDELFEATLFGNERGAFTDARQRRTGRVEAAGRGTLLFDEIDCLTLTQQAKMLRLVDRRRFERVGGVDALSTEAAFLFASNRDLRALAASGLFRYDLLARVSWLVLKIPPLRERTGDIALLATLLLEEIRSASGQPRVRWSVAAMDLLRGYSWPGNVRELKALVTVVSYLHADGDTIEELEVLDALSQTAGYATEAPAKQETSSLVKLRTETERRVITAALRSTAGNRVQAAKLLKIGRRTLQMKIAKYGL